MTLLDELKRSAREQAERFVADGGLGNLGSRDDPDAHGELCSRGETSAHRAHGVPVAGPVRLSLAAAIAGRSSVSVIAEFKRRSPSAGAIAEHDLVAQVKRYEAAGAAAVSVLTEASRFGGSYADLELAARRSSLPILMKDFVVSPLQIEIASRLGASAVLLIVRCLDDVQLRELHYSARSLGLDTLVECHDVGELERALALESAIVGINNRDLEGLGVDLSCARKLLPLVPTSRLAVAESGYSSAHDVSAVRGHCDAVLCGSALMRSADPSALIRGMSGEPTARAQSGARRA